jgi:hypothetical protein
LQAPPAEITQELTTNLEIRGQELMCFFDLHQLGYIIRGTAIALFGPYTDYKVLCKIEDIEGEILGKFELPSAITHKEIMNTHDRIEFFHLLNGLTFPKDLAFQNNCTVTVSYIYE